MTAALDVRSAVPAEPPGRAAQPWRTRILPVVDGLPRRAGWLAALAVGLLAGLLRFVRLGQPPGRIFDEIYYSCDAQNLLRFGVEMATRTDTGDPTVAAACIPTGQPAFIVHPPLGKWAIALGIKLFGANEFGWRFAAAVAGTLTVVLLVRLTRRMTGSTVLGVLAGLLLSLDGLHFVQSRIAMLDIFLVLWTTAAVACLVADRDDVRRRLARAPDDALAGWGPRLGLRPWRLAAGVCLGAALATKWSALYYVAVLVLLSFAWEVGARRAAGIAAPLRATLIRSTGPALGLLVILPAALYVLSWAGWFASDNDYDRQWARSHPASGLVGLLPDVLRSWWAYHGAIYDFHAGLSQSHPYQSHPVQWLLLARPVSYFYPSGLSAGDAGCTAASCSREVLALGTPALWWPALVALVLLVWLWLARRDWRAGATLALVATGIVPWIRDDLHGRTMFVFYALPAVPFLCLAVALIAGWAVGGAGASLWRRRLALTGAGAHLALVLANFAYLYPILAAVTIPFAQWRERMWFPSWI